MARTEPRRGADLTAATGGSEPAALDAACPGSIRIVKGKGTARHAAWWMSGENGRLVLASGRSVDEGRSWEPARLVDTTASPAATCRRPPPAVSADERNGIVHVAYFLEAREGGGVFYAHQMDPRAAFEPPIVIVYGDRPATVSIASSDSVVALAYDDPNNRKPSVMLALSFTSGHTFLPPQSPGTDGGATARPSVEIEGDTLRVWWTALPRPDIVLPPDGSPVPGERMMRIGILR